MITRKKIIWGSVLFAVQVLALNLPSVAKDDHMKTLPKYVGTYDIDKTVQREAEGLPSQEAQISYLTNVFLSDTNNFRKASAIRLLGVIRNTNAVSLLILNLDFEDTKYRTYPAVEALIAIGEPAVAPLLAVLERSEDKKRIELAVQTLMRIKGADYEKFIQRQKSKMPAESWKNLLRYAIDD